MFKFLLSATVISVIGGVLFGAKPESQLVQNPANFMSESAKKSTLLFQDANHRRLLQVSSCYLSGSCNLTNLRDGRVGFVANGDGLNGFTGASVSGGDINADGVEDFVVFSPRNAYVVFGSRNTSIWGDGNFVLKSLATGNGVRGFVAPIVAGGAATVADVNGDNITDLIVLSSGTSSIHCKAYVVFGNRSSLAWGNGTFDLGALASGGGKRGFVMTGEGQSIGANALSAADLNGDGIQDVIMSDFNISAQAGRVYVLFGSRSPTAWNSGTLNLGGLATGNGGGGFVVNGEGSGHRFGYSVGGGDINGDGIQDLIVGADGVFTNRGNTYVIWGSRNSSAWGTGTFSFAGFGSGNGLKGFVAIGNAVNDHSGSAVGAGDINGDGIQDLIVGAVAAGSPASGLTYVLFGERSSMWNGGTYNLNLLASGNGAKGFIVRGEASNDKVGVTVFTADVNKDGISDLIVGAYGASSYAGKAYVVFGFSNSLTWNSEFLLSQLATGGGALGFVLNGEQGNDQIGVGISAADINGDGVSDLILGAFTAWGTPGDYQSGRTYVLFGPAAPTSFPTNVPTSRPSLAPTKVPTTAFPTTKPTVSPTLPTRFPTSTPTHTPSTRSPTAVPTSRSPTTRFPTLSPTTRAPTSYPTTYFPTTHLPTPSPTLQPTTPVPTSLDTSKISVGEAPLTTSGIAALSSSLGIGIPALLALVFKAYSWSKRALALKALREGEHLFENDVLLRLRLSYTDFSPNGDGGTYVAKMTELRKSLSAKINKELNKLGRSKIKGETDQYACYVFLTAQAMHDHDLVHSTCCKMRRTLRCGEFDVEKLANEIVLKDLSTVTPQSSTMAEVCTACCPRGGRQAATLEMMEMRAQQNSVASDNLSINVASTPESE